VPKTLKLKSYFLTTTYLSRVQYGHPCWHEIYSDDVQRLSSVFMNARVHRGHSVPYAGFKLTKIFFRTWKTRNNFNHMMAGEWISREAPISWLPRSPNLTPLEFFFLSGYVKNFIYQLINNNLHHLKACIKGTVLTKNKNMTQTCGKISIIYG
jgi:hypothetical protein